MYFTKMNTVAQSTILHDRMVSHNKFQDFNVDKQGAVLNNATTNVKSQIAGQIKANANLKGNAANLIIKEVTGSTSLTYCPKPNLIVYSNHAKLV